MEPADAPISATTEERRRRAKAGVYSPYPFRVDGRRLPTCVACKNHGLVMLTRGHRMLCPFRACSCAQCSRHQAKNTKRLATKQASSSRPSQLHSASPRRQTSPDSSCRDRPLVPLAPRPPGLLKTRSYSATTATTTATAAATATATVTAAATATAPPGPGSGGATAGRASAVTCSAPAITAFTPATSVDSNNNSVISGPAGAWWYGSLASKIVPLPSPSPATPDSAERRVTSTVTSADAERPPPAAGSPPPPPPPPGSPARLPRQRPALDDVLAAVTRCESRAAVASRRLTESAARYHPYGTAGGRGASSPRPPLAAWPPPWAGEQSHWRAAAHQSLRSSLSSWSAQGAVWNQISYGLTSGGDPGSPLRATAAEPASPPAAPTARYPPGVAGTAQQRTTRTTVSTGSVSELAGGVSEPAGPRAEPTITTGRSGGPPADTAAERRPTDGQTPATDTSRNLYNWLSKQIDVEQRPGEEGALRRAPPRTVSAGVAAPLRLLYVPSLQQTPFSQLFRQLAEQPQPQPPLLPAPSLSRLSPQLPAAPAIPSPPHELPFAGQLPPFWTLCAGSSQSESVTGRSSPPPPPTSSGPPLPTPPGWPEQAEPAGWPADTGRFPAVYDFDAVAAEEGGSPAVGPGGWAGLGGTGAGLLQSPPGAQRPVSADWSCPGTADLTGANAGGGLLSPPGISDPTQPWLAYQQYQQQFTQQYQQQISQQYAQHYQQQYMQQYQQQLSQLGGMAGWTPELESRWMTAVGPAGCRDPLWPAPDEFCGLPVAEDLSLSGAALPPAGDGGPALMTAGAGTDQAAQAGDLPSEVAAGHRGLEPPVASEAMARFLEADYDPAVPAAALCEPSRLQSADGSTAARDGRQRLAAAVPDPLLVCQPVMSLGQPTDQPGAGQQQRLQERLQNGTQERLQAELQEDLQNEMQEELERPLVSLGPGAAAQLTVSATMTSQTSGAVTGPAAEEGSGGLTASLSVRPLSQDSDGRAAPVGDVDGAGQAGGPIATMHFPRDGTGLTDEVMYPVLDVAEPALPVPGRAAGGATDRVSDPAGQEVDITDRQTDVPQGVSDVAGGVSDVAEQVTDVREPSTDMTKLEMTSSQYVSVTESAMDASGSLTAVTESPLTSRSPENTAEPTADGLEHRAVGEDWAVPVTELPSDRRDPGVVMAAPSDVSGPADCCRPLLGSSQSRQARAPPTQPSAADPPPDRVEQPATEADHSGGQTDHSGGQTDHSGGQTDHSRGQLDHSRGQTDHSRGQLDHSGSQLDHSGGQADHSGGQADHSGGQADHSGGQTDHSGGQSDHSGRQTDHPGGQSDHSGGQADHSGSQLDHSGGQLDHSGGQTDHSGGQADHSRGQTDHSGGQSDHSRGQSDHSGWQSDHSGGQLDHSGGQTDHSGGQTDHSGEHLDQSVGGASPGPAGPPEG